MSDVTNFIEKDFSLIWVIGTEENAVKNSFNIPTAESLENCVHANDLAQLIIL